MYEIRPQQNRDYVLSKIDQEQIMEFYLQVPIQVKNKFKSPLREDNNPSCAFFYSQNGKLYFRDFSQEKSLDCFDIASKVLNLSFRDTLRQIINDFNLNGLNPVPKKDYQHLQQNKELAKAGRAHIEVVPIVGHDKHWAMTPEGLKYWETRGISVNTLIKYKILQLDIARCNGHVVFTHSHDAPGFAYYFGGNQFKLYLPFSTGNRFIQNTTAIQGEAQLPYTSDLLVITKSLKDVMLFHEYGVDAIAPQSESFTFDDEVVADWQKRFTRIVIVYDKDYTGVKFANKWRKKYGWEYAFVEGAKDISDLYVASPYHCEQWINKLRND